MIGFIAGLFVGGFLGVVIMCIMSVAGHSDCGFDDTIIQYDGTKSKEGSKTKKE